MSKILHHDDDDDNDAAAAKATVIPRFFSENSRANKAKLAEICSKTSKGVSFKTTTTVYSFILFYHTCFFLHPGLHSPTILKNVLCFLLQDL